jgi:hypothetical protein
MNNLPALPWYRSPQQIGLVTTAISAVIALFPKVGQLLGWSSPTDVTNGVTTIFGFIAVVAPVIGSFIRARSTVQPLTLTKADAAVHPNTIAAAQEELKSQTPPPIATPRAP